MTGRSRKPAVRGPALQGLVPTAPGEFAVTTLPIREISLGASHQPRRRAEEANLQDLTASVREKGVLQPLLVRSISNGYELVAGERRLRAAELAGLAEVPVLVRELNDTDALEVALIENLQREGLEIIDEVDATLRLVAHRLQIPQEAARDRLLEYLRRPENTEGISQLEALFTLLGRGTWQSFVKNKLRILNWPPLILAAMRDHGLPYTIAGVIAASPPLHHEGLLAFALTGASKTQVRAEAQRLNPPNRRRNDHERTIQIARKLSSERWLTSLDEQSEKDLEAWLKKMPARLKQTLQLV